METAAAAADAAGVEACGGALGVDEAAAWVGLLRAHAHLTHMLDLELRRAHGVSLVAFEVLLLIGAAPDQRARMGELTRAVLLSPGGLTRLVDRLVEQGLVARERCPSDARGAFAVLTDDGRQLLELAGGTHAAGVRRHLCERLGPEQTAALGNLLGQVAPAQASSGAASCPGPAE